MLFHFHFPPNFRNLHETHLELYSIFSRSCTSSRRCSLVKHHTVADLHQLLHTLDGGRCCCQRGSQTSRGPGIPTHLCAILAGKTKTKTGIIKRQFQTKLNSQKSLPQQILVDSQNIIVVFQIRPQIAHDTHDICYTAMGYKRYQFSLRQVYTKMRGL